MLNYLWAGMIAVGIVYGVFSGNMEAVTNGALDSAKEAISLCLNMCGVMALWMGLMEIAQTSGLIERMTRGISPFITFLFPLKFSCNHLHACGSSLFSSSFYSRSPIVLII